MAGGRATSRPTDGQPSMAMVSPGLECGLVDAASRDSRRWTAASVTFAKEDTQLAVTTRDEGARIFHLQIDSTVDVVRERLRPGSCRRRSRVYFPTIEEACRANAKDTVNHLSTMRSAVLVLRPST